MSQSLREALRAGIGCCAMIFLLSACQSTKNIPAPAVATPLPPQATYQFVLPDERDSVVGHMQVTHAHADDTLSDIARRFNIGYEEIVRANPGVDPWLPREGTAVVLPTQFILPDAPRNGVVINLAALRLFYFPPAKKGEPQTVITHPIGIGQVGWSTPVGNTKIISKRANPVWSPPASVRKEHAEDGEVLPAKIGPGPDNPLGKYAFTLDWPSYLIHGTNQPYGVGLRASHGCIRLYPEDIAQLYDAIPVGTKVTVVNQPQVYGVHEGVLYMQSYPELDDYEKTNKKSQQKNKSVVKNKMAGAEKLPMNLALDKANTAQLKIDKALVDTLLAHPNGVAVPVSLTATTVDKLAADAPRVENRVPDNATWDGVE